MADGSQMPIEQVQEGDRVLAADPDTGRRQPEPVTDLITGQGEKNLVDVTVETDQGTATVTATDEHPFWVDDLGAWATADQLRPGAWLRTGAGTRVQVGAVRAWTASHQRVRNLSVDDLHTFYVMAGSTPLLVHNTNGCGKWKAEFDALPNGKQSHVKEISTAAELRKTFERWTKDAKRLPARGSKIPDVYQLPDGTCSTASTGALRALPAGSPTPDTAPARGPASACLLDGLVS